MNKVGGKERVCEVLEKSPLVRQLDKRCIDQQRKKLMALTRFAGESLECYTSRVGAFTARSCLAWIARLTRRDKVLVRARAGDESEEAITNVLVELAAEWIPDWSLGTQHRLTPLSRPGSPKCAMSSLKSMILRPRWGWITAGSTQMPIRN